MKLIVKKRFFENLSAIKSIKLVDDVDFLLDLVNECKDADEIPEFKFLLQHANYGRIVIRPFRIGVEVTGNTIIFHCILHRSEIYDQFP